MGYGGTDAVALGVDHDHLWSSLDLHGFTPDLLSHSLSLLLGKHVSVCIVAHALMFCVQISLVTAKGSKWEATSFCKCTPVPSRIWTER